LGVGRAVHVFNVPWPFFVAARAAGQIVYALLEVLTLGFETLDAGVVGAAFSGSS
jgi:hypothetical protein